MADETTLPRQDGAILHGLKECPAWVIIALFVAAFLIVWNISHDDFIPRIIDGLIGALLTSIIAQRPKAATNIKTDSVDAATMDNANIHADNLNVKK